MFDPQHHVIKLPRRVKDPKTGHYTTIYDDYLEVKWRLVWFREKCPHGVIETTEICVDLERGYARYRAVVSDGEGGHATGYGTETAAGFADYVERAETRALGRALAALGIGTQFVGQDLTEGEHVADAPVRQPVAQPANGQARETLTERIPQGFDGQAVTPVTSAMAAIEPEARITQDEARALKKTAQTVFGYVEGERRLRADLGFEVDEKLTLRHLAAHVTATQYATVMSAYDGLLRQQVESDVPDHQPLASVTTVQPLSGSHASEPVADDATPVAPPNGQLPQPDREVAERQRWGSLSRRSMAAGLSPSVWESLRAGAYEAAERVIVALEQAPTNGAEGRGVDG